MTTPPAGTHLIADLHGCLGLADPVLIERALRAGVTAARATLLDLKLHHFGPEQGVTGVALLAESHISIHSWPEHGYAAIDIFLCGAGERLDAALEAIASHLRPTRQERQVIRRGVWACPAPLSKLPAFATRDE
jgi:S-adenosylmethionine decarboxylase